MGAGRIAVAAVLAAAAVWIAACGGSDREQPPGSLAPVLATVGGGGEGASEGVGWVDLRRLGALDAAGRDLYAAALAPNADGVLERAPALSRRLGFAPDRARDLVSVGGSYAFGLRADDVRPGELAAALLASGGRERRAGETRLLDVGAYAQVPQPLLDLGLTGLGARDAFEPSTVVLAISNTARATLLGRGGRLSEQPVYTAASSCLGDVVAARLVPAKLVRSTELGTDLVAIGVRPPPNGRSNRAAGEVLCLLGGDAGRADELEGALEQSLSPGARDPVTGEPLGRSLAAVESERVAYGEIEAVRVELAPAPGAEPGFLFTALARGAIPRYLAAGAP